MSLFQIISIASFTIILAFIAVRLFVWVRPRLTVATAVLFAALICLGLWCYFGVLTNYVDDGLHTRAQLLLRDISYNGLLVSMGLAFFLGAVGFILLAAQAVIRRTTTGRRHNLTNEGPEV